VSNADDDDDDDGCCERSGIRTLVDIRRPNRSEWAPTKWLTEYIRKGVKEEEEEEEREGG
jgi:hypothetical protein